MKIEHQIHIAVIILVFYEILLDFAKSFSLISLSKQFLCFKTDEKSLNFFFVLQRIDRERNG